MSVNSLVLEYSCWTTHHWDRTAFFALPPPLLKDLCSPRRGSASGYPAPVLRKHHPLRCCFLRARCQGEIEVEALYGQWLSTVDILLAEKKSVDEGGR